MKRAFLLGFAALVLILSAVQTEARTYYQVTTTRTVTAPPIYWQYYGGVYVPMATQAYYSVPPMYRPVRVYQPGFVPPPPPPIPYGYPPPPPPRH